MVPQKSKSPSWQTKKGFELRDALHSSILQAAGIHISPVTMEATVIMMMDMNAGSRFHGCKCNKIGSESQLKTSIRFRREI